MLIYINFSGLLVENAFLKIGITEIYVYYKFLEIRDYFKEYQCLLKLV